MGSTGGFCPPLPPMWGGGDHQIVGQPELEGAHRVHGGEGLCPVPQFPHWGAVLGALGAPRVCGESIGALEEPEAVTP